MKRIALGRPALFSILVLLTLLAVPTARAGILSASGSADILDPSTTPTGATPDFFNENADVTKIHGWNELQNFTLDRDILVDAVTPGAYGETFSSADAIIPRGTIVSSHLLMFDPLEIVRAQGSFTFQDPILGVIMLSSVGYDHLLPTDFLGNVHTLYPTTSFKNRGVEFQTKTEWQDRVAMDLGRTTLSLDLLGYTPGDQVRVITQGSPIPVGSVTPSVPLPPAAWAGMATLAGLGVVRVRKVLATKAG